METALIGTFIRGDKLPRIKARNIFEIFDCEKIFCFETIENGQNTFLLTFNVSNNEKECKFKDFKIIFKNSIQLHRNKNTNTLYTLNSLNKIIEIQNGTEDKNFKVNWNDFKDCCILLDRENILKKLNLKLRLIFEIQKEN